MKQPALANVLLAARSLLPGEAPYAKPLNVRFLLTKPVRRSLTTLPLVGIVWVALTASATGSTPTISSISPAQGPTTGGTTVTITGNDFQVGAKVTFDAIQATDVVVADCDTIVATTPAHGAASVQVRVTNPDNAFANATFTYGSPLAKPTYLRATQQVSAFNIILTWTAPAGWTPARYEIARSLRASGSYPVIGTSTSTTYTDLFFNGGPNLVEGETYVYRVRACPSQGDCSDYSDVDPATVFTDQTISPSTYIKATQIAELRIAVEVRLTLKHIAQPVPWTPANQGELVKAAHISELRQNVAAALGTGYSYTYTAAQYTVIHAADIQELIDQVK